MKKLASKDSSFSCLLPKDYLGPDQHGRPILVERVGAWNVQEVLDATEDLENFSMLHAMADETLLQMDRPKSTTDPRGFMIMCWIGTFSHHSSNELLEGNSTLNPLFQGFSLIVDMDGCFGLRILPWSSSSSRAGYSDVAHMFGYDFQTWPLMFVHRCLPKPGKLVMAYHALVW